MTTESESPKAKVQEPAEEPPAAAAVVEKPTETKEAPPPPVKQTKSVVLTGFGGPKYVRVQSKDQRAVGNGEIAIDVEACGVGFQDLMTRQGLLEFFGKPPFVMGSECCGKVVEIGDGVTEFKVGDEVIALVDAGAWTEHLVVKPIPSKPSEGAIEGSAEAAEEAAPASPSPPCGASTCAPSALVFHKPADLTANQAAVILMSYLPAYLLLHKVACVRSGDVVLVHSAGGGVGTAIGQLAKLISGVKLIGTASPAKHEKLTPYYSQLISSIHDYATEIKKEHPQGVTVVLDSRSGEDTNKSLSLLQPLGRYIIYGNSSFVTGERKNLFTFAKAWLQMDRISPLKLLEENKVLGGFALKQMIFRQRSHCEVVFEAWKELTGLLSQKKIEPIVDSEWSFEETKEALQKLQDRSNFGKIVISPKLKPNEAETDKKTEEAAASPTSSS